MSLVLALLGALRASLRTRTDLALENLALRQQLALFRRRPKRTIEAPELRAAALQTRERVRSVCRYAWRLTAL